MFVVLFHIQNIHILQPYLFLSFIQKSVSLELLEDLELNGKRPSNVYFFSLQPCCPQVYRQSPHGHQPDTEGESEEVLQGLFNTETHS